jgi:hypothetical protein
MRKIDKIASLPADIRAPKLIPYTDVTSERKAFARVITKINIKQAEDRWEMMVSFWCVRLSLLVGPASAR